MTPTAFFKIFLAIGLVFAYAYNSRANGQELTLDDSQIVEDLNGDVGDASLSSGAVKAVLDSINGQNPTTPAEWMKAVGTLRRMGAYAEAKSFLDQAMSAEMDDVAKVELHAAIGTAELVGLSVDTKLPEAREFVFSIFNAVKAAKRNPEKLLQHIEKLADKDEETRRVAMRDLAAAGSHAVPALVSALRLPQSDVTLTEIEKALARLGKEAEEPLIALLGSPDPTLQATAARVLGGMNSKRAPLHLIRLYFVGQGGAQQAAAAAMRRAQSSPSSVSSSADLLARRAKFHLEGNPPVRADFDGNVEMWTWSAEKNNVVANLLNAKEASAVAAARFARDAFELNPTLDNTLLLLVTRLEVDQSIGGLDAQLPKGVGTAYQFGSEQGIGAVCQSLDYSLKNGHDAAAIGAMELMSDLCQSGLASGNRWTALTRPLQHPNRRIRYAAVRAIMKIDPRRPYAGSSFFMEALMDLTSASGSPGAVVGMARRDANDSVSGLLSSLGFSVMQVNEAGPLLHVARKSSDYDVLFLSDSVSNPPASETIQVLRKNPTTKRLPIVLMAREGGIERARRIAAIDEMTTVLPEFADEQALIAKLEEVEKMVVGKAVSPARRLEQARDAIAWLTHLTQYSQTYKFYDLQRANDVALQGVAGHPVLSSASISLLGYLGGEAAQKQLVELVSQRDVSTDARQRAANAFTESVGRHGLMLRSADVYRQYDRYNAIEKDELKSQEVLGQVLDVIETQTRQTSVNSVPF